jgi:hypothetical protein
MAMPSFTPTSHRVGGGAQKYAIRLTQDTLYTEFRSKKVKFLVSEQMLNICYGQNSSNLY